jgi:hypothetical protein
LGEVDDSTNELRFRVEMPVKLTTLRRFKVSDIAGAILDRLVNSSHQIDLKGESLRKGILKNK